jgi:hypothetical protein
VLVWRCGWGFCLKRELSRIFRRSCESLEISSSDLAVLATYLSYGLLFI